MKRKFTINRFLFLFILGLIFYSCNVKKYIPDNELLYTGADLELNSPDSIPAQKRIKEDVEAVLRPKPNSKFLGSRIGLWSYYKNQQEKPGFINKFIYDKFGEDPVYASDVDLQQTRDLINNRLENRGYFYSQIQAEIQEDSAAKIARTRYEVYLRPPYRLENFQVEGDSLKIQDLIRTSLDESYIEKDMRFDLVVLKAERERIDRYLKKRGYYNFNHSFLIFETDTNQYNNKKFDLFLQLKDEVPEEALIPYEIEEVNIYANYGLEDEDTPKDSIRYENKNFIQNPEYFKPKYLEPYVLIDEGDHYNPEVSRNTSRRLGTIGAYRFVNIRYDELETNDSIGKLAANIYLSPLKKRSIRAELQGVTKSNNFAGPALALTFTNRNLFKGGETLNISAKLGYERQIAGGPQSGLSSTQLGFESDLIFPRMLFPVSIDDDVWFEYAIPKTRIGLGAEYLNRTQLFSLISASSRFGYMWEANRYVTHEFNPVSLNYVRLANVTQEFQDILDDNPFLENSFNQRFISGLTYSFTYNGHRDSHRKHQFFIQSTLDVAGNSLDLFSNSEGGRPRTVFGQEYAQYAKADVDFRYHLRIQGEHKIATRLFGGYGLAYGNSEVLPFVKQYFSGGPYSVRAFRIRSLGPGTYNPDPEDIGFFDQSGNIRLEANAEYRFPIYSFLKGAVFVDAGNVWNSKQIDNLPGGKFSSDFINEFGIGGGAGLRIDIQSFVIRFDLAAPFHDPRLPRGERWTFDIGSPIFNFAIGYPF